MNGIFTLIASRPLLLLPLWMIIMDIVLLVMMASDKRRAKHKKRRIPEKRLFAAALLGGAVGGWAGMCLFRHKTKHWYFVFGFAALSILQITGAIYVLSRSI